MKQNKQAAFGGATPKQKKKKLTRAEKKAAKKAQKELILPVHKRPIVCPPDKAGRSPLFRYGGIACRSLVIWLAASGLMIFVASALELGVPNLIIFLASLAVVLIGTIFRLGGIGKLVSVISAAGAVGGLVAMNPALPLHLFYGLLTVYNGALDRLYKVGYLAYVQYKADVPNVADKESLMVAGVCLLTVLITVMFSACLTDRKSVV